MSKDQELVERIRNGDQEAFSLLVKPLLSSSYKTVISYLGQNNTQKMHYKML